MKLLANHQRRCCSSCSETRILSTPAHTQRELWLVISKNNRMKKEWSCVHIRSGCFAPFKATWGGGVGVLSIWLPDLQGSSTLRVCCLLHGGLQLLHNKQRNALEESSSRLAGWLVGRLVGHDGGSINRSINRSVLVWLQKQAVTTQKQPTNDPDLSHATSSLPEIWRH